MQSLCASVVVNIICFEIFVNKLKDIVTCVKLFAVFLVLVVVFIDIGLKYPLFIVKKILRGYSIWDVVAMWNTVMSLGNYRWWLFSIRVYVSGGCSVHMWLPREILFDHYC